MRHVSSTAPTRGGSSPGCRERKTLTAERAEHVNRIKGLLLPRASLNMSPYCAKDGSGLRNSVPMMVVRYRPGPCKRAQTSDTEQRPEIYHGILIISS